MSVIRIGSRESLLAVRQSELVMEAMRALCPGVELELVTMKTTGDKILDRTLDQVGGKGLFVRELDAALLEGRVDITVHSLKDLPMETHPDLPVVAFPRRADPRDVLVLPEGAGPGKAHRLRQPAAGDPAGGPLPGNGGPAGPGQCSDPVAQAGQRGIRRSGPGGRGAAPPGAGGAHRPVFLA